jgi:hypothetical protein
MEDIYSDWASLALESGRTQRLWEKRGRRRRMPPRERPEQRRIERTRQSGKWSDLWALLVATPSLQMAPSRSLWNMGVRFFKKVKKFKIGMVIWIGNRILRLLCQIRFSKFWAAACGNDHKGVEIIQNLTILYSIIATKKFFLNFVNMGIKNSFFCVDSKNVNLP